MNVACPECRTVYRIDPARVPDTGVTTACRECGSRFRVDPDASQEPGVVTTAAAMGADQEAAVVKEQDAPAGEEPVEAVDKKTADAGTDRGVEEPRSAPAFGPQDPDTRARRLARALVSDIKVYNPDKWEESRSQGTLRKEFRDEILKSWEEYVEQVGDEMAKRSPFFRDALNDILAGGDRVF